MPIKILLADRSITIQKVVEMLFSGKEYEVFCVSDGETALTEASRIVPDVVLADIDLPRIDGYSFSARLKQMPALSSTPVILMMSRDDVFDDAKARQSLISDHIAKPFESQELIGKVKKAVAQAGPKAAVPPSAPRPAAAPPKPEAPPPPPRPAAQVQPAPAVPPVKQKQPAADIFDIIEEAPSEADLRTASAPTADEEAIYEVEPVVEVEEQVTDAASALPEGDKAVEEMRAGLGLASAKTGPADEEIVSFESFDAPFLSEEETVSAPQTPQPESIHSEQNVFEPYEYVQPPSEPAGQEPAPPDEKLQSVAEEVVARVAREHFSRMQPPIISEEKIKGIAEEIISPMAHEHLKNMAPLKPLPVSEAAVQKAVEQAASRIVNEIVRDVIERVAWEVVPDLAATLIKAEIERLKAET